MSSQLIQSPLSSLRDLLSHSDTFQTLVGAANDTEAIERIHYGFAEDTDGDSNAQAVKPFPRIIVAYENYSGTKQGSRTPSSVQMAVRLESVSTAADREKARGTRYYEFLGVNQGIIDDIWTLITDTTFLSIEKIDMAFAPQPDEDRTINGRKTEVWVSQYTITVQG